MVNYSYLRSRSLLFPGSPNGLKNLLPFSYGLFKP